VVYECAKPSRATAPYSRRVLTAAVLIAAGAVLLVAGSEAFAEHVVPAARVARVSAFGLAALVAGAEPEEAWTAGVAAWRDRPGLAIGDAVGANLVIATATLGLLAVVAPIAVTPTVRRYCLVAGGAATAGLLTLLGGRVARPEGIGLIALYLVIVGLLWRHERRPPSIGELAEVAEDDAASGESAKPETVAWVPFAWVPFAWVLGGLAAMMVGGIVVVAGAERLVDATGRGDSAIGFTVLALATSAEMLALVWSARRRGVPEIALAGVLGAVAYNATVSLGVAAVVRPLEVPDEATAVTVSLLAVAALAVVAAHRRPVRGWTGGILITAYLSTVTWLLR
jgi:cation:H+ antiporter